MSTYLTTFPPYQNTQLLYRILSILVCNCIHNIKFLSLMILVNNSHLKAHILKQRNQHIAELCIHASNLQRKQRLCQNSSWACWLAIQPGIAFCDHISPPSYLNLASVFPAICCLIKRSAHLASLRRWQLTKLPSTSMLLTLIFTVLHNIYCTKFSKYY